MHDFLPDHLHLENVVTDETDPIWASERIKLRSVGIDIGSSTTHLTFSELVLRRLGHALSTKYVVTSKEIIQRSRIILTPFVNRVRIDAGSLSNFLKESYKEAGLSPDDIDTGAVIITGEASRRENAKAIAELFAGEAGKFVCAVAGPNLESVLAAHGSGAVELSHDHGVVMNVDVGGGTSKIAIASQGEVVKTASLNVGSRLLAFDADGRVVRLEDAGSVIARYFGIDVKVGSVLTRETRRLLARGMAELLSKILLGGKMPKELERLWVTEPLTIGKRPTEVVFSGGVAEYIYGFERADHGDLGNELGSAIRELVFTPSTGFRVMIPPERIRATVIGASQYSVQVSGSTILVSSDDLLPLYNARVIRPKIEAEEPTAHAVESSVIKAVEMYLDKDTENKIALAINWRWDPSYQNLSSFAKGIVGVLRKIGKDNPILLVFDADVGRAVGRIILDEVCNDCRVISIDALELGALDFVDIGSRLHGADAVPVVIKSLVFRG